MDGWKTSFLFGKPYFRCYVSFREGISRGKKVSPDHMLLATASGRAVFDACIGLTGRFCWSVYGGFLKWWYPQNTPKWSFLVGKPMVVGYHHFRKHPYGNGAIFLIFWTPTTTNSNILNLIQLFAVLTSYQPNRPIPSTKYRPMGIPFYL